MKGTAFFIQWCVICLACAPQTRAQQVDSLIFGPDAARQADAAPRVFLDCRGCDLVFLRREIPFVDYVRDRQVADLHLLITEQRTGSGGSEFRLNFIGQKEYLGVDQRLVYTLPPGGTFSEERSSLAERIKLGLVPYLSNTSVAPLLRLTYVETGAPVVRTEQVDPWRSWVFEVEADASFGGQATQRSLFVSAGAAADRVTEKWKFRTRLYADQRHRRFEQEGDEPIRSTMKSREVVSSVVYSLAGHWSAGLFGRAYSDTYENIDVGTRIAPAIEFSVYPYEESARKEITVAYRIGFQSMNYIEETIFGETSESLPNESVTATLRATQPWGSMFIQLEGSHFMHDFSKNRLEFFSNVSVRVFRGLAVRASGGLEIIHDQLYLPRGEGTLEDLLLQQKQLATTYEYRGSVGVSYTFGSIFSNVVNTRL